MINFPPFPVSCDNKVTEAIIKEVRETCLNHENFDKYVLRNEAIPDRIVMIGGTTIVFSHFRGLFIVDDGQQSGPVSKARLLTAINDLAIGIGSDYRQDQSVAYGAIVGFENNGCAERTPILTTHHSRTGVMMLLAIMIIVHDHDPDTLWNLDIPRPLYWRSIANRFYHGSKGLVTIRHGEELTGDMPQDKVDDVWGVYSPQMYYDLVAKMIPKIVVEYGYWRNYISQIKLLVEYLFQKYPLFSTTDKFDTSFRPRGFHKCMPSFETTMEIDCMLTMVKNILTTGLPFETDVPMCTADGAGTGTVVLSSVAESMGNPGKYILEVKSANQYEPRTSSSILEMVVLLVGYKTNCFRGSWRMLQMPENVSSFGSVPAVPEVYVPPELSGGDTVTLIETHDAAGDDDVKKLVDATRVRLAAYAEEADAERQKVLANYNPSDVQPIGDLLAGAREAATKFMDS